MQGDYRHEIKVNVLKLSHFLPKGSLHPFIPSVLRGSALTCYDMVRKCLYLDTYIHTYIHTYSTSLKCTAALNSVYAEGTTLLTT